MGGLMIVLGGALGYAAGHLRTGPIFTRGGLFVLLTIVATGLVFLMTIPGLALFYGGMVRKFNVLATVMQCFAICCAVSLVWMILGYSLAFTAGTGLLGGLSRVFLSGLTPTSATFTIPESVFMMFQMSFAVITPALITGAFADRMKFSALLLFTVLWSLIVYAPIAHWAWEATGWLFIKGVLDFAGGTVVHINAGVAGLIAAIVIGRRNGYPVEPFLPHNLVLSVIGASFLGLAGWLQRRSALTAGPRAGMALAVTHIAASAAAMSWSPSMVVARQAERPGGISGAVPASSPSPGCGLRRFPGALSSVSPPGSSASGVRRGSNTVSAMTTVSTASASTVSAASSAHCSPASSPGSPSPIAKEPMPPSSPLSQASPWVFSKAMRASSGSR